MFKVRHTEDTVNRTFRFPKSLLDKISVVAQNENVSINSLVVQCCEYAIDNLSKNNKEEK